MFFTGQSRDLAIDRILTTVLFTDIVRSTENTAALGDLRWRQLLDEHDGLVREELRHHRGREINTTGDGFVASLTALGVPSAAPRPSRHGRRHSVWTFAPGYTLGSARCEARTWGLAVHIAARVGALAEPNEILRLGNGQRSRHRVRRSTSLIGANQT